MCQPHGQQRTGGDDVELVGAPPTHRPGEWGWAWGQGPRLTSNGCRFWSAGAVEGAEPFSAFLHRKSEPVSAAHAPPGPLGQ